LTTARDGARPAVSQAASGYRWNILLLLASAQVIAFVDRVNFAVVGPQLIGVYHYTPGQVGFLLSVFNWAYTLSLLVGITSGLFAAVRPNSKWDYSSMTVSMLGISVPTFVLGPILVLFFSLTLYWFPPARWDGLATRSAVLPVLTLSVIYMAYIARLTRSGMLEVLRSDYIRTARAKGLSETAIVLKHAFRGGIIPVVSLTGPALAGLITGTVVVERIFVLPGLGTYFINANLNRDEPLILGIVAFISITILVCNLLVDVAYAYIDPRIRY